MGIQQATINIFFDFSEKNFGFFWGREKVKSLLEAPHPFEKGTIVRAMGSFLDHPIVEKDSSVGEVSSLSVIFLVSTERQ